MSFVFLAIALATLSPTAQDSGAPSVDVAASESGAADAARHWLDLVDAQDWKASYEGTSAAFRQANTLELWTDASQRVQAGLGKFVSRDFIGADDVPSPQGFTMVKFRADYAKRKGVLETLSLVRENGAWKIAGIYVS